MVKEKVMSELKQRIAEAGLDHIISVNEDVNKMGTFIKRTDELKSYNDKFQKRIFIKNLIWSIIPDINRFDDDFVASEDLKTIEETIWSYIYETPQDTEMLLFFAHQILHCKMYDDDNKITIDVPKILQYIQDKDLKDALMMYIRREWLDENGEIYIPDDFLEEVALAMKYLK